jgi:hypothetical protein
MLPASARAPTSIARSRSRATTWEVDDRGHIYAVDCANIAMHIVRVTVRAREVADFSEAEASCVKKLTSRNKVLELRPVALFRYAGKKTWYYDFHFAGQHIRESAKTRSKEMARRAENARRRDLETNARAP